VEDQFEFLSAQTGNVAVQGHAASGNRLVVS
jgi:hypothetical protein